MVHAALLLLMLGARTTVTPFHHQPEAQHLKSLATHKNAGRLPHLLAQSGHSLRCNAMSAFGGKADIGRRPYRERPGPHEKAAGRRGERLTLAPAVRGYLFMPPRHSQTWPGATG